MAAKKKKKVVPTAVRVKIGGAKTSDEERVKRSGIIETKAKTSPLYLSNPILKAMADELAQLGVELQARMKDVADAEHAAEQARAARDEVRGRWDRCMTSYGRKAETCCATNSDLAGLGLEALLRTMMGLVAPAELLATFDAASRRIRLWAKFAGGKAARCVFEISPDPITPTSYTRLEGHAAKRWLENPGRGTWWVRVAMVNGTDRSDWVGPVSVIIQ